MSKNKAPINPVIKAFFVFAVGIFITLALSSCLVSAVIFFLVNHGYIKPHINGFWFLIFFFAVTSIILATFLATFFAKNPLKRIIALIEAMEKLSKGEYETRLRVCKNRRNNNVEEAFNALAEELENTEMLRSDFINDFSHEFKTPIVSIKGFAKLLQKAELDREQKKEYIDIIAEESDRLAKMAANVLDLTRIDNQNILTDVTEYNLSEQIRKCVLLLEKQWTKKNIEIEPDFDEVRARANKSLLRQVWVNLLDNAVKFSDPGETIVIRIKQTEETTAVSISDTGVVIEEKDRDRIFRKFYQADTSHSGEGTGIGLAMVKKIAKLHEGEVSVESNERRTTFTFTFRNDL
jgi:signal transduction histidine kinase